MPGGLVAQLAGGHVDRHRTSHDGSGEHERLVRARQVHHRRERTQVPAVVDREPAPGVECRRLAGGREPLHEERRPARQHLIPGKSVEVEMAVDEDAPVRGACGLRESPADRFVVAGDRPSHGYEPTAGRVQGLLARRASRLPRWKDLGGHQPGRGDAPEPDHDGCEDRPLKHEPTRAPDVAALDVSLAAAESTSAAARGENCAVFVARGILMERRIVRPGGQAYTPREPRAGTVEAAFVGRRRRGQSAGRASGFNRPGRNVRCPRDQVP